MPKKPNLMFFLLIIQLMHICVRERGTLSAALPLRLMTAQTQLTPRAPPKTDYLRYAFKENSI